MNENSINQSGFNPSHSRIIIVASICSILIIILTIIDIVIGTILGGDLGSIPQSAISRFSQLNTDPFLGLYYLDFLNLITTLLMIPVFYVLFLLQCSTKNKVLFLSLILFGIGTTLFISNNVALPMLDLSHKYLLASASQKSLLAAAGEALLVKGAHGSMGAFMGFSISMTASLLMSFVMIKTKFFGKLTGWFGMFGSILLLIYLILVSFVPGVDSIAMVIAAPGGILSLIWIVLFTFSLLRTKSFDF